LPPAQRPGDVVTQMQTLSPPAAPPRPPVRLQWMRVLVALVVREMATKFGRSWGGYFWAIAEPLGGILMLTAAFSFALRTPPLGNNFALFYATGIIPFFLFSKVSNAVSQAITSNRGLLNYPVVRPLDTVLAKFVTDFLTMFVVGVLLYTAIIRYYALPVTLDLAAIFNGFLLMGLLGLGIGTLNCVITGFWPTWRNIWNVLTKPLFIVSGMFYTFESLPPQAQAVLWWNPLIHGVGLLRSGFYAGYDAGYVAPLYVLGIALGCLFVGGRATAAEGSAPGAHGGSRGCEA
jgi:capsular polysaccharide transport system permease protein